MDLNFDILPPDWKPGTELIKVIGVGGGGCNAVTYMYEQKVEGCSFIVCNTDSQALARSSVPTKIQLGQGLGAGTDPAKGRKAAIEAQDEIARVALDSGTQMLFITAGLGGGTGTGASPVIAKMAKERGILTVAVVTVPFDNEGNDSHTKAIDGIHELEKNVDSLLIIKNEKLYEFFGDQLVQDAFPKADEVLATAVRGITEIISKPGYINVDFEDIKTMMKGSGCAIMGCGTGTGEHRIEDAVREALDSPLLGDYDLSTAKNVLVNITAGYNDQGLKMAELGEIDRKIKEYTGKANNFKKGLIWDRNPEIGDRLNITAIVTGLRLTEIIGPSEDTGNNIYIYNDFIFDRTGALEEGEEISLPQTGTLKSKIGYNTLENRRSFNFNEDDIPVLITKPGDDRSRLENEPAIRRSIHIEKKNN